MIGMQGRHLHEPSFNDAVTNLLNSILLILYLQAAIMVESEAANGVISGEKSRAQDHSAISKYGEVHFFGCAASTPRSKCAAICLLRAAAPTGSCASGYAVPAMMYQYM